jgi:hypothetical protein
LLPKNEISFENFTLKCFKQISISENLVDNQKCQAGFRQQNTSYFVWKNCHFQKLLSLAKGHITVIIVSAWLRFHNLIRWFSQSYRKIGPSPASWGYVIGPAPIAQAASTFLHWFNFSGASSDPHGPATEVAIGSYFQNYESRFLQEFHLKSSWIQLSIMIYLTK